METNNQKKDQNIIPNDIDKPQKGVNVPNLRFDNESWTESKMGNVCSKFDYGIGAESIDFDGENRYIRITDIDEENSHYIRKSEVSPSFTDENCIVKENDILFARTGASTGKTYLYNEQDGKLYFAGFLIRANVRNEFSAYFIYQQTKINRYKKWIQIMSARSGQPGINAKEYQEYKVYYPNRQIQDKVASFFTLLDQRIDTQSKIIEDLECQIKWIRYKIFSCSKNTQNHKLSEYLIDYTEKNINNLYSPVAVGKYGIRKREDIYSKELATDYSKNKVIYKNTLIIGMGSTQIDIGILFDDEKFCVSPAYTTYKIKNINSIYLKELLIFLNPLLSKKYMIISSRQGKSVNKEDLLSHYLFVHSNEEQDKIATLFRLFYKLINKEKDILELYKKQKAYLLKNMFI